MPIGTATPRGRAVGPEGQAVLFSMLLLYEAFTEPSTAKPVFQLQEPVLIHRLSCVFSRGWKTHPVCHLQTQTSRALMRAHI